MVAEVSDNGPGIPPAMLNRVFEPFFTTKPVGQGTGLGLFLCRNIVRRHGGELRVRSTPQHGTTFVVDFHVRLPDNQTGPHGQIAEAFNEVAQLLEDSAREFSGIATAVGKEGKIKQRASLGGATGCWSTLVKAVLRRSVSGAEPIFIRARYCGSDGTK